ncbi:hypothetical protein TBLA_0B04000 [Henningerozyma blattae CBS 6284]|uniref:Uncharacterized protein n=1 Tax=Henningerozyma blattae (strain ATCC 34711 / CBS 6284 / DSM 70876 / NBRC 10599 / NRRL Y-10934 / UCD 77-7) TaxID=1071380 RepID=I2GYN6_HENB6|nr:hypothetical protein TBLA_0B04000 [Tetrapisispora blattae CBS 6284]CCH59238.1 hypothetical protein TBLA_0B04000 [Tetrapisispora blattae CBS 6284]
MTIMNGKTQYEHISSYKPIFQTSVNNVSRFRKTITFTDNVVPDTDDNTLTTQLLYSQGSNVYEIDCVLPLESFNNSILLLDDQDNEVVPGESTESATRKPDLDYGKAFESMEKNPLNAKWAYQGETITKLTYISGSSTDVNAIGMASNGSLAWFRDGVKVPVHIMQEMMGPGTSFSSMHSIKGSEHLAVSDFSISFDSETVVKSHSNGSADESILKIVDNSGKPGELLRKLRVPGTTVTHAVRFLDNHMFVTCSDDNIVRFWDTRTKDEPLFILSDPNNGLLTSFDVSPVATSLFATGSDTGIVKLWDVRAVSNAAVDLSNRQNGEDPIQTEIVTLHHAGGDNVVDIHFSETSSNEFVTVGGTGDVYHWDMSSFMSEFDDDNDDTEVLNLPATEEVNSTCLKFFHTGGSKRSPSNRGMKNTVAWHPVISDLIGTVDVDSLISVYKPFTAPAN